MTRPDTPSRTWRWIVALVGLLLIGSFLAQELVDLSLRPMHADEAVHAVKFNTLYQGGGYRYDPRDYHGPTLYYLAWPIVRGCGVETFGQMKAWMLRMVPLLGLLGCCLLVGALSRCTGGAMSLAAMALVVFHPAAAFYATTFIQETLLVLFTLATIFCAWRYFRSARAGWALGAGAGAGLMLATKETAVIHLAAMAAAGAIVLWARGGGSPGRVRRFRWALWVGAAMLGGLVWQALVTAGFTHVPAVGDSLRTFWLQLGRAGGGDHRHQSPLYYFDLLVGRGFWRAAPNAIVLAGGILGGIGAWSTPSGRKGLALLRFVALYTLIVMAIYSLLPYKTPWLVLGWLVPLFLLFDTGASLGLGFLRLRARWALPVGILLVAAVFPLLGRSRLHDRRRGYDHPACPWAYAPTHRSLATLSGRVEQVAGAAAPDLPVVVLAPGDDYWPLPWQLRRLDRVGYFDHVPEGLAGPVILVHQALAKQVAAELYSHPPGENPLYVRLVGRRIWLRPGVEMIGLVRKSVLDAQEASP